MERDTTDLIDESLYSRQIFALGTDAMKKMTTSSVLITCRGNLSGSALELAKCIILAGVNRVSIHVGTDILTYRDLSSNYYASEKDIGKPFVRNVIEQLSSLNTYVKVDTLATLGISVETLFKKYACVVCCDYDVHQLFYWNRVCRQNDVKFIMLQSYGLMFHMFCDFGDKHVVADKDGEPSATGIIKCVKSSRLTTIDPHNLFTGDIVTLDGPINGLCTDINGESKSYIVKTINSTEFVLQQFREDHLSMTQQQRQIDAFNRVLITIPDQNMSNVTFRQIKTPVTFNLKSLQESLKDPQYIMIDTVDWDMPKILNAFMTAMSMWRIDNKFIVDHKTFVDDVWEMYPISDDDITNLKRYFYQTIVFGRSGLILTKHVDRIFDLLARTCSGSICGIDAIAGSMCAQEVIKAISNKFTPTIQFVHFESLNILPDDYLDTVGVMDEFSPCRSRYDGQIVIFGKTYLKILRDKKLFIVGAGAIGCEHIKNFSMMGIRNMIVTDMDHIENSNLNRQFLFRKTDIGQPKSVTAALKAKTMNPEVRITAQQNKVGRETLNIYNQDFFKNIDIIANALDNIEARLFVDSLCVKYRKPLLEAGTLGTKGNVQCIIPDLTESYGSLQDPPEQSIAVCTLKLFPYKYEHIVQYARDVFEGFFNRIPQSCKNAASSSIRQTTLTPDQITTIHEDLMTATKNSANFKYCINFAYKQWHILFRDVVNQIIQKYPLDHTDDEDNAFWSGNKIYPTAFEFDISDSIDINFIVTFSHIWADAMGIPQNKRYPITRIDRFVKFLQRLNPPKEVRCKDVGLDVTETESESKSTSTSKSTVQMIEEIAELVVENKQLIANMQPVVFEKDDDTNNHIDFITSLSNKRAANYHIEPKDRLTTKSIAGKIIPAIATTTSVTAGLVSLELYKTVYGQINKSYNTIERYRYGSFNLAVQSFGFSESYPAKLTNIDGYYHSIWTRIDIDADTDLESVIDAWSDVLITKLVNNKPTSVRMNMDCLMSDHGILYSNNMESDAEDTTLRELILRNYPDAKGEQLLMMTFEEVVDSDDDVSTTDLQKIDNDSVVTVRVRL